VSSTADLPTGRSGNRQDGAHDDGDDAENPDDIDTGQKPDDEQDYAKYDHLLAFRFGDI
jgi:hypothetical protein